MDAVEPSLGKHSSNFWPEAVEIIVQQGLRTSITPLEDSAKSARRSYDQGKGPGAIPMVSAWASQNRLVLGPVKVDRILNEITAIPKLLAVLDLRGCIVSD